MSQTERMEDRLSDFERAVCYYTLPRVTSPVTIGLIAAYALCLLEAGAATVYGLLRGDAVWTRWGTICFVGMVVFGVVAFLFRAFLNDFRQRRALASARGVPDAGEAVQGGAAAGDVSQDVPDPFENHVLLRYPRHSAGKTTSITDNSGNLRYTVEVARRGREWKVCDADGEVLRVEVEAWARSFSFDRGAPSRLVVRRGEEEVATIRRRPSLTAPTVEIVCRTPSERRTVARARSLYKEDVVVGRIYYIRRHIYLDVEEDCFDDGILCFFVAMV